MANITSINGNPILPYTAINDGSFNHYLGFEQGLYGVADGEKINSGETYGRYVRSVDYVPIKYYISSLSTGVYKIVIAAYDTDGTYVGVWNGTEFSKTWSTDSQRNYANLPELSASYPDYSFKLDLFNTLNGTTFTPTNIPTYFSIVDMDAVRNEYVDSLADSNAIDELGCNNGSYNSVIPLEQGYYDVATGAKVTSGSTAQRYVCTSSFLPPSYEISYSSSFLLLLAFDSDGTYVGCLNESQTSFEKVVGGYSLHSVSIAEISERFPNYLFKLDFGNSSNPIDVSFVRQNAFIVNTYQRALLDALQAGNYLSTSAFSTRLNYEYGYYAVADGSITHTTTWARTPWFVPKTLIVKPSALYYLILVAYEPDGTYVGVWNGSEFVKVYGAPVMLPKVNIAEVAALYPDYMFKLDFTLRTGASIDLDDLAESVTVEDTVLMRDYDSHVPNYYIEHMATKNAAIRNNIDAVGINGETFLFITDIHWENNHGNSPSLVKSVLDNTNVRLMLCGGDVINTKEKAEAIAQLQEVVKAFDFPTYPMHMAFGNHDANSLNWSTTELQEQNRLSANEAFGLLQKNTSFANNYVSDTSIDYYFDRQDSRTRFIFLDSGTDGAYASVVIPDLCEMLNNTPNGYRIVIVQHWYLNGVTSDLATLTTSAITLMNAVKQYNDRGSYTYDGTTYSFASAAGEVVLLLGGHTHYDYVIGVDDSRNVAGVPLVCTSDDSWRDRTATAGTIAEQCFDVITIDYTNHLIKCVRIGDGQDREIEY